MVTINYIMCLLKFSIFNIIIMLIITLVVASITLMERKVLSLSQRRVGPSFVGFKGRLQYIADALKLFLKYFILPSKSNKVLAIIMPSAVFSVCYTFWINSLWGLNLSIIDIEFNFIYSIILSIIFSICIIITGYASKNKYAFIASIRSLMMVINLELLLGLFILTLFFFSRSLSLSYFSYIQEYIPIISSFFIIIGVVIIIFFLETGRAPFDLQEAESELVSGYNTEYGGFYFALYYLGEYFHLFFFSAFISITLLGSINNMPNILKSFI